MAAVLSSVCTVSSVLLVLSRGANASDCLAGVAVSGESACCTEPVEVLLSWTLEVLALCVPSLTSGRAGVVTGVVCWGDAACWVLDEAKSLLGVAAGASDGLSGVVGS